ncbi:hypothetical protein VTL71DRAFT_7060 [Oculimacula yallundae]|uniref:Uncharacterized protein n=1 Tax=Oculimacula yallundae TaxID=86028 RepID=A0ABR4BVP1_9HELO
MLDVDCALWEWIEIILQKPIYEHLPISASHPVLGTPRRLNKLVFEISKMYMRTQLTEEDLANKERLGIDLTQWEAEDNVANEQVPVCHGDQDRNVKRLYIICARILFIVIEAAGEATNVDDTNDRVRVPIARAMGLILEMDNVTSHISSFPMRWPLRVLSLFVEYDEDLDMIRTCLRRIWSTSACGDVKRNMDGLNRRPGSLAESFMIYRR